jgi:hypothetical protein
MQKIHRNKIEVVVARHRENLSWLSDIKDLCSVYNKAPEEPLIDFPNAIPLENIGREADTYLKHIIRKYPYFPDYVIFTQGRITDHVHDVGSFVKRVRDIENGTADDVKDYEGLNEFRVQQGWSTFQNFQDTTHGGLALKEWWFKMYNEPPNNNEIRCNYCGVFLASKKNILYHSLEFYQELERLCREHPTEGPFILERFWTTIFDGQTSSFLD